MKDEDDIKINQEQDNDFQEEKKYIEPTQYIEQVLNEMNIDDVYHKVKLEDMKLDTVEQGYINKDEIVSYINNIFKDNNELDILTLRQLISEDAKEPNQVELNEEEDANINQVEEINNENLEENEQIKQNEINNEEEKEAKEIEPKKIEENELDIDSKIKNIEDIKNINSEKNDSKENNLKNNITNNINNTEIDPLIKQKAKEFHEEITKSNPKSTKNTYSNDLFKNKFENTKELNILNKGKESKLKYKCADLDLLSQEIPINKNKNIPLSGLDLNNNYNDMYNPLSNRNNLELDLNEIEYDSLIKPQNDFKEYLAFDEQNNNNNLLSDRNDKNEEPEENKNFNYNISSNRKNDNKQNLKKTDLKSFLKNDDEEQNQNRLFQDNNKVSVNDERTSLSNNKIKKQKKLTLNFGRNDNMNNHEFDFIPSSTNYNYQKEQVVSPKKNYLKNKIYNYTEYNIGNNKKNSNDYFSQIYNNIAPKKKKINLLSEKINKISGGNNMGSTNNQPFNVFNTDKQKKKASRKEDLNSYFKSNVNEYYIKKKHNESNTNYLMSYRFDNTIADNNYRYLKFNNCNVKKRIEKEKSIMLLKAKNIDENEYKYNRETEGVINNNKILKDFYKNINSLGVKNNKNLCLNLNNVNLNQDGNNIVNEPNNIGVKDLNSPSNEKNNKKAFIDKKNMDDYINDPKKYFQNLRNQLKINIPNRAQGNTLNEVNKGGYRTAKDNKGENIKDDKGFDEVDLKFKELEKIMKKGKNNVVFENDGKEGTVNIAESKEGNTIASINKEIGKGNNNENIVSIINKIDDDEEIIEKKENLLEQVNDED